MCYVLIFNCLINETIVILFTVLVNCTTILLTSRMIRRQLTRCFSIAAEEGRTNGKNYFQQANPGWWTHNGELETLHNLNSMRVPFIRNSLLNLEITSFGPVNSPRPLDGWKILDVGCGGGILSEALARLGAQVTGIDISQDGIEAATEHADKDPEIRKNLVYYCSDIDGLAKDYSGTFDAVVASEVIEHVPDVEKFVNSCTKMGNDQASIFFTTINRTWKSYLLAIIAAEYILRIIPVGVHQWDKFVTPGEIEVSLLKRDYKLKLAKGMEYCPMTRRFKWSDDLSVNYALHAVKS